jgi:hypothetical protein
MNIEDGGLPMIDTGHEHELQKMLHFYKEHGRRAAIEDAMQHCRLHHLIDDSAICDELKSLVDEVQSLYAQRTRRGEVKARRGRSSTPDVHVDRFARVVKERNEHQTSLNKAVQVIAQQNPVTSPENVRRSYDFVDKATGDIEGDYYQRLYPEPED